jgi:PAS domain S-box-containing protein
MGILQTTPVEQGLAIGPHALIDLAAQKYALDQHAIVGITDVQGTITYVNEKFCAISGYSRDELIGQNHRILNSGHHPKEFFQKMYRTIAQGEVWHGEIKNRAKDGSIYWVDATIVPILGEDGKPCQYIAIRADITERKRMEEALEQSRNNQIRFKDEFLSHVSHELRSPLTAIKQFTTILLGGLAGELNGQQREFQQIVLKNVLQLQAMIDDLLEVTRLEAGKLSVEPESVSVAEAVIDCFHTLQLSATAKGVTLAYNLPPDLPSAHADPTRLRQTLIILLDNAVKFTPEGGAVGIQASVLPQDPQFLLLEVSDTGCGMSPEVAERIFERLYQVSNPTLESRKGLGLGLYICKELVARQGGQISVRSQPQKGSTFSFTLPVFSLRNVLAPLLRDDRWPAESVALVRVETRFLGAGPAEKPRAEWSREVRRLVERCLMPNLDVLLPKMSVQAEGERFFVAALANEKGASILTNRIREQFERLPLGKRTGLTLSASYTMLKPHPAELCARQEDMVTSLAANLEELIKSEIDMGGSPHEQ